MENKRVSESSKRKNIETVSPASNSGSSHDDDKLKVKRLKESSSSLPSEIEFVEDKDKDWELIDSDSNEYEESLKYWESNGPDSDESAEKDKDWELNDPDSDESTEKDKDWELNDPDSDESEEDKDYKFTDSDSSEDEDFSKAKGLAARVMDYYNDETRNNKDTMEVIKIKEAIGTYVDPDLIYFLCFEAKFTPKDEKETRITHCRSVIFVNTDSDDGPWVVVFSCKRGPLKDEYIKKWTEKHADPGLRVLYSEFTMEKDTAPPLDQTHTVSKEEEDADTTNDNEDGLVKLSNRKEEDVDTNNDNEDGLVKLSNRKEEEDADTNNDNEDGLVKLSNIKEEDADTSNDNEGFEEINFGLTKEEICPMVEEFTSAAVAYYNDKEGYTRMKLIEIKEALSLASPVEEYHINFDAVLLDKDGKETKLTSYQAVVSEEPSGLLQVWFLKEANDKDNWCKENNCVCEFPPPKQPSREEVLKSKFPEWCFSSDDEEEQEKETESCNLLSPASTHLENQGDTQK